MSAVLVTLPIFDAPPFYSAHWLSPDLRAHAPRMVVCFVFSSVAHISPDQAAALGLESVLLRKSPVVTTTSGAFEGRSLVLSGDGQELMRTGQVPTSLTIILRWCAEVLLVWIDVPLQDPATQLSLVGLHHVWTGIVTITDSAEPPTTVGPAICHSRTAPARRPAPPADRRTLGPGGDPGGQPARPTRGPVDSRGLSTGPQSWCRRRQVEPSVRPPMTPSVVSIRLMPKNLVRRSRTCVCQPAFRGNPISTHHRLCSGQLHAVDHPLSLPGWMVAS